MRVPARILAAAALAALASTANAADAACAGTSGTAYVCAEVNPAGVPTINPTGSSYTDCVYLGAGACKPVTVPIPTVTPGSGSPASFSCGGRLIDPILACG